MACQSPTSARVKAKRASRSENAPRIFLTFDEIVAALPDIEVRALSTFFSTRLTGLFFQAYAVPSEKTCLAFLGCLEEICFPLLHRLVFDAVFEQWKDNIGDLDDENRSSYVTLPMLEMRKSREDAKECAVRMLFNGIIARVKCNTAEVRINEPELSTKGVIEELFERVTGPPDARHAVLKCEEDDTGVRVFVSRYRLKRRRVDMSDVLKACLHKGSPTGTHIFIAPYRRIPSDDGPIRYGPQIPMFFRVPEDGEFRSRPPCESSTRATRMRTRARTEDSRLLDVGDVRPGYLDDLCFQNYHARVTRLDPTDAETRRTYHPSETSFYAPEARHSLVYPDEPDPRRAGFAR